MSEFWVAWYVGGAPCRHPQRRLQECPTPVGATQPQQLLRQRGSRQRLRTTFAIRGKGGNGTGGLGATQSPKAATGSADWKQPEQAMGPELAGPTRPPAPMTASRPACLRHTTRRKRPRNRNGRCCRAEPLVSGLGSHDSIGRAVPAPFHPFGGHDPRLAPSEPT